MAALTRAERIGKLARAIWDYRGRYNGNTSKWIKPPQPKAGVRVRKWLESLGVVDIEVAMKRIDGFKSQEEFRAFLKDHEWAGKP